MYKCPKYVMAAAVAMALSGFAVAEDGTSGPGKSTGNPVADRGTERDQNPGGGARADQTGNDAARSDVTNRTDTTTGAAAAVSGSEAARQIRQFASEPDKAGDRLFVLGAGTGNLWEVEFSRLVEERAQDRQVKELAKLIRQDHEQANQKLQSVAQNLNVQIPGQLPEEKQAKLELFRAMPAEKLEKCYLGMAKAEHAQDIINYQVHQNEIQDSGLREYVAEVLPKLQQHGQHVQQVATAKGIQGGDITSLASASGSDRNINTPGMNSDRNNSATGANTGTGMGPGGTDASQGSRTDNPTASRQE